MKTVVYLKDKFEIIDCANSLQANSKKKIDYLHVGLNTATGLHVFVVYDTHYKPKAMFKAAHDSIVRQERAARNVYLGD